MAFAEIKGHLPTAGRPSIGSLTQTMGFFGVPGCFVGLGGGDPPFARLDAGVAFVGVADLLRFPLAMVYDVPGFRSARSDV